jgi:Uma2 family endonuclease
MPRQSSGHWQNLKKLTIVEYFTHQADTDQRYELIDEELVALPPESEENNDIDRTPLFELAKHFPISLLTCNDTEIEVSGRQATCRIPDLLVHTEESKAALAHASRTTLSREMPPPALEIQVVSPGKVKRNSHRQRFAVAIIATNTLIMLHGGLLNIGLSIQKCEKSRYVSELKAYMKTKTI